MRAVLGLILLAAVVVAGAWYIQHLVGAITLTFGAYTVQAPLSVAVLALLLFVLVLYGLFRVLAAIFGVRHVFRRHGEGRSRRRGDEAVTSTLVALAAREPADARREAAKARRYLGDTPQTLLLAAYAGSIGGDEAEAQAAFEKLAERKESAFLGYRGLLRQAVAREDWPRAAELARDAERAHPGAAWLKAERTHLAVRSGDWQQALQLTRGQAPNAAVTTAAAEAEQDPSAAAKLAKDAWKRDRSLAPAALAYARRLREAGRERAAQDVLRQSWTASPHPDLADYALAPAPDRVARVKAATALVRDCPNSAESQLLLGRVSLEAGQTVEAQRHAEAALAAGLDQKRLHVLMADIAEAGGADEAHRAAAQEAVRRAAAAPPDPVWRCEACGTVHGHWHAACPKCHTAGRIRWMQPQPQGTLIASLPPPA